MRILAVVLSGLIAAVALTIADRPDAAAPADTTGAAQTVGSKRADAARRIRERAQAARAVASVDGWRRGPRGFATYYARLFDGRQTASGTIFDNDDLVAAHPAYPFGTRVRVTNLRNGRTVLVTVVDRGPVRSARASGVIIDLSRAAAERLDFIEEGRTRVRLEIREPEDDDREES